MKQYKFSLNDECMIEEVGYHPNFFDVDKEEISVPKEFLSSFIDDKIYNEDEFEIISYKNHSQKFVAPIPKQKVDDTELWKDIFLFIESHIKDMTYEEQMEELQKHYTITRK
jgi:hypothetical protein